MCQQLDKALENYATVIKHDLGVEVASIPGSGAAGGLGAGLIAFLGAKLRPGIDIVCDIVGISRHLEEADLVITGEGRIDNQTSFGKTIIGIARRAKTFGVPVIAIGGELAISNNELAQWGIDAAISIAPGPISLEESSANTHELIIEATERALRLIMVKSRRELYTID
jgi:glycerate kinase